jgi:hypothetical protein
MKDIKLGKNLKTESLEKIPYEISEYIRNNHFDEEFFTDIRKSLDSNGKTIYNVEISSDGSLYKLKFNSEGKLIENEMDSLFESEEDEYGFVE